jgi:hypothetical protein
LSSLAGRAIGVAGLGGAVVAADGRSEGFGREPVGDRVQVDQGGRPEGLQSGLGGTDVAGFSGAVAVDEQAQEPLDPRPGAAQVLGGVWVVERLAGSISCSS